MLGTKPIMNKRIIEARVGLKVEIQGYIWNKEIMQV